MELPLISRVHLPAESEWQRAAQAVRLVQRAVDQFGRLNLDEQSGTSIRSVWRWLRDDAEGDAFARAERLDALGAPEFIQ